MWIPCLTLLALQAPDAEAARPSVDDLRAAGRVAGVELTDAELELMRGDVLRTLAGFERMRALPLENGDLPALGFSALVPGVESRAKPLAARAVELPDVERPADLERLAFADIPTLASLIKSRKVSCVELTELFLARLERLDGTLHCVITLTPERARAQAAALDAELERGEWRGLLHGIPWGAKDLLAVRGYPTTWGAKPYAQQVLDLDATVVERLDAAGAVLIAKLTLGALAMGDVWFGETTRNPWKPEDGSSGSSAGSASATAAGALPFALGTETLGSIVSPATRCGATGLRPTFGRVSRHGAMALSWSMDKLGPLTRSARDAALVFAAIEGPDGRDPSVSAAPFSWNGGVDVEGWVVGYPRGAFDQRPSKHVLAELEALGVELRPLDLPRYPVGDMRLILSAEAATLFDELTRSGRDEELVRQSSDAWPNIFRSARLIPAVEYLRAQRLRTQLMRDMHAALADVDLVVHPSFDGLLVSTNLTGHPTLVAPAGFRDDGTPYSISFTGQLFDDARLCAFVWQWQLLTGVHERHPELSALEAGEAK